MRRIALILGVAMNALPAFAEDVFTPMTGAAITEALTDARVQYASAWQEFRASGRTLYNAGSDSWGYWEVRGDQYCSQWPPRSEWACYDMARNGDVVRFIGVGDDVTDGRLQP
ncbi:hypothetical protein ACS3SW_03940 [Roseobacteraceae bacterium S113]